MEDQREIEKLRSDQKIARDYEKRLEELQREREQKKAFDFKGKREVDQKISEVERNQEKLFRELKEQHDIKVTSEKELESVIAERERQLEKAKLQEEQAEIQGKEVLERGYQAVKEDTSQEEHAEQQQETDRERSRETYNKKFLHELKEKNDKLEIAMRDKTRGQLLAEGLPEIREEDQEEIREEDQELGLEGMSIGERETEPKDPEGAEMEEQPPQELQPQEREMERGHSR